MGSVDVVGSQIDVGSIVKQLMELERQPVYLLENQVSSLKNKITAYQTFNTKLSALSNAVNTLLYNSTSAPFVPLENFSERLPKSVFASRTATSSNENVLTATASGTINEGIYSISVSQLAQAQTSITKGYSSANDVLDPTAIEGSIIIGGETHNISLAAGSTLRDLQEEINNRDIGINATLINDGGANGIRLMLTSKESGTANEFVVTADLDTKLNIVSRQDAKNAELKINGIDISSSSNTVKDAISGITLNLKNTTTGAETVKLDVGINNDDIVSAVKDMVSAYNEINAYISSQFAYDADTGTTGVLSGDMTLRSVQSRLQSVLTMSAVYAGAGENAGYRALGNVGLSFERDGSLTVDESKLRDALSKDYEAVSKFFLGYDDMPDPANSGKMIKSGGFMTNLGEALKGLTDPLKNPIKSAMDGFNNNISSIEKNIAMYEVRLQAREDLLYAQWSAADQALRLMQVTLNSISNSLASLNSNNN